MCLLFCYCVIQGVSFNYHHRNVRSRVSVSVSNFQVSVSVSAFMTKSRSWSRHEIWARSRSRSRRLRSRLHHCRIQRKLCSDTTTFFFVLQRQLIKLSAIHHWMLNIAAVLILASRLKVVTSFFWPSQRVPRLWSVQRTLHLEVKYAIKPIVWAATQTRVAISQRVRK